MAVEEEERGRVSAELWKRVAPGVVEASEARAAELSDVNDATGDAAENRPDSREGEEWFQALDERAQDVVREGWVIEDARWEQAITGLRRDKGRSCLQGAVLIGGTQLFLVYCLGVYLLPLNGGVRVWEAMAQMGLAVLGGIALGYVWSSVNAGVMWCIFSGMATAFAVELVIVAQGWLHPVALFGAPALAGFCGQYVGHRRGELPGS